MSALESVLHRPLTVDCRPVQLAAEPASETAIAEPLNSPASSPTIDPAGRGAPPGQAPSDAVKLKAGDSGATPLSAFCLGCSFYTEWVSRVGVLTVFLVLFLASLVSRAIADQNHALFAACLVCFQVAMFWGVLLVPYNPIFILFLGCVYLPGNAPLATGAYPPRA
jgi:hypothetical protein